ncbi:MAG: type III pantothenate kinase [Pyrinomonadaceae bacterium]
MLLVIDIGNTSTKFGVYDGSRLLSKFAIPTQRNGYADDIGAAIKSNIEIPIDAAVSSSVVPEAEILINEILRNGFGIEPVSIDHNFKVGLKILYDPPDAVGADRLVAAASAAEKYGAPCVVCDFGTATTIDAVNSAAEYLGGAISPGMNTMADALHLKASKLPRVEIAKPDKVIGNSTIGSIRSGIFFGYIGLVEGMVSRMAIELGGDPRVVATGGFSGLISSATNIIDVVDEDLIIDGLASLYLKHSAGRNKP